MPSLAPMAGTNAEPATYASRIGLRGGVAPVRAYLPDRTLPGTIEPGHVFDLTLPLEHTPEGYAAMDERRAIKVLLTP